jgi:DNA repair exonuclease SbcCD nuclease subunit
MAFTLLHTADLHLGKSFSLLPPERAEQRRADQLATLVRLCHRAQELRVDMLCVVGDFFDCAAPPMPLVATVRNILGESDVLIVLVPGNHDPLDAHSPYRVVHWPGNVRVATEAGWQRMPSGGPEMWAFGYTRGATHRSPWEQFPGCGHDAVLLLHAACLAPGLASEANYYPFTPSQIPACAYLALGHHHRAVQVSRHPLAWYAGTPEPLEPEVTPAAALLVRLDDPAVTVEPLDVATRRHRLVTLEVTGLTGADIWDRALSAANRDDLLTLRLTGMLAATESLEIAALQAELSARAFAAQVLADEMYLPAEAATGDGALAAVYQLARARLRDLPDADPGRARVEQAVRYAALALEGRL